MLRNELDEVKVLKYIELTNNTKLSSQQQVAASVNPQVSDKALKRTAAATCSATFFEEAVCSSEEDHESPMNTLT